MEDEGAVLLSCWIVETARSTVLMERGHSDEAARAAARARLLASACSARGVRIEPGWAAGNAAWMAEVGGGPEETGAWGWFFLQRLGAYVDGHAGELLDAAGRRRLLDLSRPDEEAAGEALGGMEIPPPPPPEWPQAALSSAPGEAAGSLALIGDPHVGLEVAGRLVPAAIRDVNASGARLVAVLGDLTNQGLRDEMKLAEAMLGELEAPWMSTLGNHDLWAEVRGEDGGRPAYREIFEKEPFGVLEDEAMRVIVVDSSDPRPSRFGPFDLVAGAFTGERGGAVAGGRIGEEVAGWLRSLGPGKPTFMVMHHPPHPYLGFPPIVFGLDAASTALVAETAARTGTLAIFCGHTHRAALSHLDGIPVFEVPASREWPFGYGMVNVGTKGWSYNLLGVSDTALVEEVGARATMLFRRYARGPEEARSYSASFADV